MQSNLAGQVTIPPSKSYTHRAIILACLARDVSAIKKALISEDTKTTIEVCQALGAKINISGNTLRIKGTNGFEKASPKSTKLNCNNSGTTARLLSSVAALSAGVTMIDGSPRLRERPMAELFRVLKSQNINIEDTDGHLPATIHGGTLKGGKITISGLRSSQFISALLLVLPYAESRSTLYVTGLQSEPYVDITIDMMRHFGVKVEVKDGTYFIPQCDYKYTNYTVEGDFSSASYFLAASAITGSPLDIYNLNPHSKQGDRYLLAILRDLGCNVKIIPDGVRISGRAKNSLSINMGNYPDIVPTVAAIASSIDGETRIENIGHLRYKESDRIESIKKELIKMGAGVDSTDDSLTVRGGALRGAEINTHNDHRIAMSLSIAALAAKGDTIIKEAQVVEKSYKDFWRDLQKIGVQLQII